MMQVTTVILAGGRSRRFGRDKATLRVKDEPIAAWQARRLRLPGGGVWLSVGHGGSLPPGAEAFDRWVCDDVADGGPLHALAATLRCLEEAYDELEAAPETAVAVFVPVDMPTLTASDLARLVRRLRQPPGAEAMGVMGCWPDGKVAPLPSAWRVSPARVAIEQAIAQGQRALYPLAMLPGVLREPLAWDADRAFGVNVNREADWDALSGELFGETPHEQDG